MTRETLLRTVGASVWVSFLSACVASTLFFATFDPVVLAQHATFAYEMSREAGYTIGFLLFWLLLVLNNAVVLLLFRTNPVQ